MKELLTAAVVGAGSITSYHIQGYLSSNVKVAAIADVEIERAKSQAQKFKIEKVFKSYEEMLMKTPEIDVVSVCVPNKFHAKISVDCLNMGKDVFCEKPPALNAEEAMTMKAAAEKNKRILMFDFNNRARADSQALVNYIRNGDVGEINSAQALWIRRCGIPGFGGWFTQKALAGGGPVIDLLHMIDLALYFMNSPEPDWILAQTFSDFAGNQDFKGPWGIPDVEGGLMDVETASHAFIRFKTGQVLYARNSWAEMNRREEVSVTFQGKKAGGTIKRLFGVDGIDDTATDTCELFTIENGHPVNRGIVVEPDPKMGRERAVVNFVNTILGKEKPFSVPDDAVTLMKIIDAIYKSATTKAPVKVA